MNILQQNNLLQKTTSKGLFLTFGLKRVVSAFVLVFFITTTLIPPNLFADDYTNDGDFEQEYRDGGTPADTWGFIDSAMVSGAMGAFSAVMTNLAIIGGPVSGLLGSIAPDITGSLLAVYAKDWSEEESFSILGCKVTKGQLLCTAVGIAAAAGGGMLDDAVKRSMASSGSAAQGQASGEGAYTASNQKFTTAQGSAVSASQTTSAASTSAASGVTNGITNGLTNAAIYTGVGLAAGAVLGLLAWGWEATKDGEGDTSAGGLWKKMRTGMAFGASIGATYGLHSVFKEAASGWQGDRVIDGAMRSVLTGAEVASATTLIGGAIAYSQSNGSFSGFFQSYAKSAGLGIGLGTATGLICSTSTMKNYIGNAAYTVVGAGAGASAFAGMDIYSGKSAKEVLNNAANGAILGGTVGLIITAAKTFSGDKTASGVKAVSETPTLTQQINDALLDTLMYTGAGLAAGALVGTVAYLGEREEKKEDGEKGPTKKKLWANVKKGMALGASVGMAYGLHGVFTVDANEGVVGSGVSAKLMRAGLHAADVAVAGTLIGGGISYMQSDGNLGVKGFFQSYAKGAGLGIGLGLATATLCATPAMRSYIGSASYAVAGTVAGASVGAGIGVYIGDSASDVGRGALAGTIAGASVGGAVTGMAATSGLSSGLCAAILPVMGAAAGWGAGVGIGYGATGKFEDKTMQIAESMAYLGAAAGVTVGAVEIYKSDIGNWDAALIPAATTLAGGFTGAAIGNMADDKNGAKRGFVSGAYLGAAGGAAVDSVMYMDVLTKYLSVPVTGLAAGAVVGTLAGAGIGEAASGEGRKRTGRIAKSGALIGMGLGFGAAGVYVNKSNGAWQVLLAPVMGAASGAMVGAGIGNAVDGTAESRSRGMKAGGLLGAAAGIAYSSSISLKKGREADKLGEYFADAVNAKSNIVQAGANSLSKGIFITGAGLAGGAAAGAGLGYAVGGDSDDARKGARYGAVTGTSGALAASFILANSANDEAYNAAMRSGFKDTFAHRLLETGFYTATAAAIGTGIGYDIGGNADAGLRGGLIGGAAGFGVSAFRARNFEMNYGQSLLYYGVGGTLAGGAIGYGITGETEGIWRGAAGIGGLALIGGLTVGLSQDATMGPWTKFGAYMASGTFGGMAAGAGIGYAIGGEEGAERGFVLGTALGTSAGLGYGAPKYITDNYWLRSLQKIAIGSALGTGLGYAISGDWEGVGRGAALGAGTATAIAIIDGMSELNQASILGPNETRAGQSSFNNFMINTRSALGGSVFRALLYSGGSSLAGMAFGSGAGYAITGDAKGVKEGFKRGAISGLAVGAATALLLTGTENEANLEEAGENAEMVKAQKGFWSKNSAGKDVFVPGLDREAAREVAKEQVIHMTTNQYMANIARTTIFSGVTGALVAGAIAYDVTGRGDDFWKGARRGGVLAGTVGFASAASGKLDQMIELDGWRALYNVPIGALSGAALGAGIGYALDEEDGVGKGIGYGALTGGGLSLLSAASTVLDPAEAQVGTGSFLGDLNHVLLVQIPVQFTAAVGGLVAGAAAEGYLKNKLDVDPTIAQIVSGFANTCARAMAVPVVMQVSTGNNFYMTNTGKIVTRQQKMALDDAAYYNEAMRDSNEVVRVKYIEEDGSSKDGVASISDMADAKHKGGCLFELADGKTIALVDDEGKPIYFGGNWLEEVSSSRDHKLQAFENVKNEYLMRAAAGAEVLNFYGDVPRDLAGAPLQDSSFSAFWSLLGIGPRPIISVAVQGTTLLLMNYTTERGGTLDIKRRRDRNYKNAIKMAVARATGNLAADLATSWNYDSTWSGRQPGMSWTDHTLKTLTMESAGLAADIGFAWINRNSNGAMVDTGVVSLVHLAMATLAGSLIDATMRQNPVMGVTEEYIEEKPDGTAVNVDEDGRAKRMSATDYRDKDEALKARGLRLADEKDRKALQDMGIDMDSSFADGKKIYVREVMDISPDTGKPVYDVRIFRKVKGYVSVGDSFSDNKMINSGNLTLTLADAGTFFLCTGKDFFNNLAEAAMDSLPIMNARHNSGTGFGAQMGMFEVQDAMIRRITMISQGMSPIRVEALEAAAQITGRARYRFASSASSAIGNALFLDPEYQRYASFRLDDIEEDTLDAGKTTSRQSYGAAVKKRVEANNKLKGLKDEKDQLASRRKELLEELKDYGKSDEELAQAKAELNQIEEKIPQLEQEITTAQTNYVNARDSEIFAHQAAADDDRVALYFGNTGIVDYSAPITVEEEKKTRTGIETLRASAQKQEDAAVADGNLDGAQRFRTIGASFDKLLANMGKDDTATIRRVNMDMSPTIAGRALSTRHYSTVDIGAGAMSVLQDNLRKANTFTSTPFSAQVTWRELSQDEKDKLDTARGKLDEAMKVFRKDKKLSDAEKEEVRNKLFPKNSEVIAEGLAKDKKEAEAKGEKQEESDSASKPQDQPTAVPLSAEAQKHLDSILAARAEMAAVFKPGDDINDVKMFLDGATNIASERVLHDEYANFYYVTGEKVNSVDKKASAERAVNELTRTDGGIPLQLSDKAELTSVTRVDKYGRPIATYDYGYEYTGNEADGHGGFKRVATGNSEYINTPFGSFINRTEYDLGKLYKPKQAEDTSHGATLLIDQLTEDAVKLPEDAVLPNGQILPKDTVVAVRTGIPIGTEDDRQVLVKIDETTQVLIPQILKQDKKHPEFKAQKVVMLQDKDPAKDEQGNEIRDEKGNLVYKSWLYLPDSDLWFEATSVKKGKGIAFRASANNSPVMERMDSLEKAMAYVNEHKQGYNQYNAKGQALTYVISQDHESGEYTVHTAITFAGKKGGHSDGAVIVYRTPGNPEADKRLTKRQQTQTAPELTDRMMEDARQSVDQGGVATYDTGDELFKLSKEAVANPEKFTTAATKDDTFRRADGDNVSFKLIEQDTDELFRGGLEGGTIERVAGQNGRYKLNALPEGYVGELTKSELKPHTEVEIKEIIQKHYPQDSLASAKAQPAAEQFKLDPVEVAVGEGYLIPTVLEGNQPGYVVNKTLPGYSGDMSTVLPLTRKEAEQMTAESAFKDRVLTKPEAERIQLRVSTTPLDRAIANGYVKPVQAEGDQLVYEVKKKMPGYNGHIPKGAQLTLPQISQIAAYSDFGRKPLTPQEEANARKSSAPIEFSGTQITSGSAQKASAKEYDKVTYKDPYVIANKDTDKINTVAFQAKNIRGGDNSYIDIPIYSKRTMGQLSRDGFATSPYIKGPEGRIVFSDIHSGPQLAPRANMLPLSVAVKTNEIRQAMVVEELIALVNAEQDKPAKIVIDDSETKGIPKRDALRSEARKLAADFYAKNKDKIIQGLRDYDAEQRVSSINNAPTESIDDIADIEKGKFNDKGQVIKVSSLDFNAKILDKVNGEHTLTRADVERAGLDWDDVSGRLLQNDWAQIDYQHDDTLIMSRQISGQDVAVQGQAVFGEDLYKKVAPVLKFAEEKTVSRNFTEHMQNSGVGFSGYDAERMDASRKVLNSQQLGRIAGFQMFENKRVDGQVYSLPTFGMQVGYNRSFVSPEEAAKSFRMDTEVAKDTVFDVSGMKLGFDTLEVRGARPNDPDPEKHMGQTVEQALAEKLSAMGKKVVFKRDEYTMTGKDKDSTFRVKADETVKNVNPDAAAAYLIADGNIPVTVAKNESVNDAIGRIKGEKIVINESDFQAQVVQPNLSKIQGMLPQDYSRHASGQVRWVKTTSYDYRPEAVLQDRDARLQDAQVKGMNYEMKYYQANGVQSTPLGAVYNEGPGGLNAAYTEYINENVGALDSYLDSIVPAKTYTGTSTVAKPRAVDRY